MTYEKEKKRRKLGIVLTVVFVLALVMGAGPGINLVNPDPGDPEASFTIFGGVPVIYAWVTLWYIVQASVATIAYFCLWKDK